MRRVTGELNPSPLWDMGGQGVIMFNAEFNGRSQVGLGVSVF